MLEKIVLCDWLLDILLHIFNVSPCDANRSYVVDQFKNNMPSVIFSSNDEHSYINLAACCVDFYNFVVNNIDIKEYTTLFRLNCAHT